MLPSTISVIVIVAVAAASTAAGGGGGAASGAELLNAVPYPNPAFWSHAWPYDDTTAIVVGGEVTVQVAPPSLSNSSSHGDDPVLGEIAARYQALMRGKASAAPRFRTAAEGTPVLSVVNVQITGSSVAEALTLGPATDENYTVRTPHHRIV